MGEYLRSENLYRAEWGVGELVLNAAHDVFVTESLLLRLLCKKATKNQGADLSWCLYGFILKMPEPLVCQA